MLQNSVLFQHACFLLSRGTRLESIPDTDKLKYSFDDAIINALKQKKIDSLYYLHYDPENQQQLLYQTVWDIQKKYLEQVLTALTAAGIEVIVFKGAEFINRYYDNNPLSFVNDVDLLIRKDQVSAAQRVFYESGFYHGIIDDETLDYKLLDISDIASVILGHYELPPLNKPIEMKLSRQQQKLLEGLENHPIWSAGGRHIVFPEFDVHYQVSTDIVSDELFTRSVPSSFKGVSTLNHADTIWFTMARFYNEVALHNKNSLRDFAYILPVLRTETINWEQFLKSVHEYELYAGVFYFLSFCNFLSHQSVPAEVLNELSKGVRTGNRDWGWQLEKLFDEIPLCPFPSAGK